MKLLLSDVFNLSTARCRDRFAGTGSWCDRDAAIAALRQELFLMCGASGMSGFVCGGGRF